MKLHAKIKPEMLDALLNGEKEWEYRTLESITLTDGKRKVEFAVVQAEGVPDEVKVHLQDMAPMWFKKWYPIIRMKLEVAK